MFKEWKETGSLLWIHGKRTRIFPSFLSDVLIAACHTVYSRIGKEFSLVSDIRKFLSAHLKLPTSSGVIQEVKGLRDAGLAHMTYFYCDFRDIKKQQVTGLLASLIAQLSAKSDACYNILSALYSECDAGSRQPSDDELIDCLEEMLKLEGQPPIYIIIDGLDECPNDTGVVSSRERVLEQVEKLVAPHLSNVRICVTSRPEADIRAALTSLASHTISLHDEQGQKKDIVDYVKWIVSSDKEMRRWRDEDKEMVVDTLSRKADGM
jgi:NACHT domain